MTDFDKYEQLNSDSNIGKPELETLEPEQPKPQTRTGHCLKCGEDWRTHGYSCEDKRGQIPEQPNTIIFDQIDGCCDIIDKLLKELRPQTDEVEWCLVAHKSWRVNNLKRLKEAFE